MNFYLVLILRTYMEIFVSVNAIPRLNKNFFIEIKYDIFFTMFGKILEDVKFLSPNGFNSQAFSEPIRDKAALNSIDRKRRFARENRSFSDSHKRPCFNV